MSLYADYLTERTSDKILEIPDKGFATYRYLNEKQVYIIDIFTVPAMRKSGLASEMANMIAVEAKAKGCSEMVGTCVPSTNNSTISLKVLLAYGMKIASATNDLIILTKEI